MTILEKIAENAQKHPRRPAYYYEKPAGGDCPKTQKSILKVEDNILNMVVNKNKVNASNDFDISLAVKVENDGRSDTVFGQPGGGYNIMNEE